MGSDKRALFVCYGGGHVMMVIPIVKQLEEMGGWDSTVLGLTIAKPKLDAACLPSYGFRHLLRPTDGEALAHGKRILGNNHNPSTGIPEEESIAYLGLSYQDLVDRLGTDEAAKRYAELGRHAFLPLGPLRRAISRFQPDVVIATCSPKSERAAIMVAQERNIPSVCMIDLFGLEWDFLFDPNYADRTFVMSPTVRENFIQRGRRPSQVITTGNPAFDRLAEPAIRANAKAWRTSKGIADRKIVLWTDTPGLRTEHRAAVLQKLTDFTQRNANVVVVYRPHPSMGNDIPTLPTGIVLGHSSEDLAAQIEASDVVMVTISTCGIEAALLDKPLIKLQFTEPSSSTFDAKYEALDRLAPYETMGIAIAVRDLSQLDHAVLASISDSTEAMAMRDARRRLPLVGSAAAAAATAIDDLVQAQGRRQGMKSSRTQQRHVA